MKVVASDSFSRWYRSFNAAAKEPNASPGAHELAVLHRDRINALLQILIRLEQIPTADDPPLLERIRQRSRYDLWRLGHPYHPNVAVRLVVHFRPNSDEVVVALVGGDKLGIRDRAPAKSCDACVSWAYARVLALPLVGVLQDRQ